MDQEQNQENTQEQVTPEYSEVELKALDMGWKPKEAFEGDPVAFIDADEFVRRQPLFDKISSQSREVKELRKALDAFKLHYSTVKEAEYKRALEQLKAARAEAVTDADGARFAALDAEVKSVEAQVDLLKETKNTPSAPEIHPEFEAWTRQNRWYTETKYMREFADEVGVRLHQQGLSPKEVLVKVAEAVKKEFPQKFVNPNKEAAPNVNSSTKAPAKGGNFEATLTADERNIMNTLVRGGHMTKEAYLEGLKATRGNS